MQVDRDVLAAGLEVAEDRGALADAIEVVDGELDDEEIAQRIAAYTAPANGDRTGVLAKYATLVGSASEGAVTVR